MEPNKIYCIDALEGLKGLEAESVDLIVTDPPYPIDRDNGTGRLLHDHPQEKEWFQEAYGDWWIFLIKTVTEMIRVLKQGRHLYLFVNEQNLAPIKAVMDGYMTFKSVLVWAKGSSHKEAYGMGYHYRKSCEFILLYSKGRSERFITDHGTLLHYPRNSYRVDHPTPKPIPMLRLFISKSSKSGELVLDPFLGSGSTAIAAKQAGRAYIGFEIDPKYIALSKDRLSQKTLSGVLIK